MMEQVYTCKILDNSDNYTRQKRPLCKAKMNVDLPLYYSELIL